jgi:N-acetylmuramoyl-L-alanine amidase
LGAGSKGKSIDQMANEVIVGKHGSGHETRRKSLGISASEYAKVRARVNQLM